MEWEGQRLLPGPCLSRDLPNSGQGPGQGPGVHTPAPKGRSCELESLRHALGHAGCCEHGGSSMPKIEGKSTLIPRVLSGAVEKLFLYVVATLRALCSITLATLRNCSWRQSTGRKNVLVSPGPLGFATAGHFCYDNFQEEIVSVVKEYFSMAGWKGVGSPCIL